MHEPFGRKKDAKQERYHQLPRLWIVSITALLFLCFIVFRLGTFPTRIRSTITNESAVTRLLSIVYPFDPKTTEAFAVLSSLIQTTAGNATGSALLDRLLEPLEAGTGTFVTTMRHTFPVQYELLHQLAFFREDIASLLGMKTPQSYIIVLQNTAEKRPNGGFFGSFAVVTLSQGRIQDFTMNDSYHPAYNRPDTRILGPERFEQFLPERDIYFVGANKVGFTYHDGAHIKTLYEKSYPGRTLRGILFLRTDMFTQLLPSLTEELRRWQYTNATVDLMRGEARRGKKEMYIDSLEAFLKKHKTELIKAFRQHLPQILADHQINIYLEKVSGPLHTFLRANNLTTRFEDDHVYFWDSNIVFNKIDTFVTKQVRLFDILGTELGNRTGDIVALPEGLESGAVYVFEITYTLQVPERYHQFIRELNKTYGIVLGQREEHILGLDHQRATRGNVYLPPVFEVYDITGDVSAQWTFETPFSHNGAYETHIATNNQTNTIRVQVIKK